MGEKSLLCRKKQSVARVRTRGKQDTKKSFMLYESIDDFKSASTKVSNYQLNRQNELT
ncbi:hypothetical protein SAMN04487898_10662 [Pedobacter sp. ok626]|nr:hypothetical protein SAMN04487898_10662 [Pedobacter sp. ok626]